MAVQAHELFPVVFIVTVACVQKVVMPREYMEEKVIHAIEDPVGPLEDGDDDIDLMLEPSVLNFWFPSDVPDNLGHRSNFVTRELVPKFAAGIRKLSRQLDGIETFILSHQASPKQWPHIQRNTALAHVSTLRSDLLIFKEHNGDARKRTAVLADVQFHLDRLKDNLPSHLDITLAKAIELLAHR